MTVRPVQGDGGDRSPRRMPGGLHEKTEAFEVPGESSAYAEAEKSRNWYARYCRRQKFLFQASEVVLLVVSASVPVAGIAMPGEAKWPAILGAVTTTLIGCRAVFHWRENWVRGTAACAHIVAEMRLYSIGATPYQDNATRDATLLTRLNEIESNETQGWISSAKLDKQDTGH